VTDPPQGRDAAPPVAALAAQVVGLRRDTESLSTKIDSVTNAQEEHAATLDGIAELRRQVEQILALVEKGGEASPGGWFWLTMNDQEREGKLSELYDWVETVLRPSTPGT
jgi:hypothetical protein